jgi:hypothetical protein
MNFYKINEEFWKLEEFTLGVSRSFDHIGLTIQDSRNIIKKVDTPKVEVSNAVILS